MWINIKNLLENVDPLDLSESELWSYQYLKHELRLNLKKFSTDSQFYLSNKDVPLTDFSSDAREEYQVSLGLNYTGDKTAYRVQFNYAHEPTDGKDIRWDGTYLTHLIGNWAIGAGSIDRWWGPGWQSSMILSNNARPTPGVFLQRNRATAFTLPILKYLGPWQLTTFMNQLESNRDDYENPRLWGMRFNFRPHKSLEIGLSRTAMWAGEGRPSDLDTFIDLLIGRDNREDDGTTIDNEPGNQLAGVDVRWGSHFGATNYSIYGQLIGEDEANGSPSRHIGMAGLELNTLWNKIQWRLILEGQNSTVYFYESDKTAPNVAYEHSIYSDGYRYRTRSIGASSDNDTEAYTLALHAYLRNGHYTKLSFGHYRINWDNSGSSDKNVFGTQRTDTNKLEASYFIPLSDRHALTIGGFYFNDDIPFEGENINFGGYLQLSARR